MEINICMNPWKRKRTISIEKNNRTEGFCSEFTDDKGNEFYADLSLIRGYVWSIEFGLFLIIKKKIDFENPVVLYPCDDVSPEILAKEIEKYFLKRGDFTINGILGDTRF